MFAFRPKKALKIEAAIAGVLFASAVVFAFEPTREFLLGSVIEKQFRELETFRTITQSVQARRIRPRDLEYIVSVLDGLKRNHPGFILRDDVDLLEARAFLKAGERAKARTALSEILRTVSDPLVRKDAALELSRLLTQDGQSGKALAVLEENRNGSPEYKKDTYALELSASYARNGRASDSARRILSVSQVDPENLSFYIRTVRSSWSAYSADEQRGILKVLSRAGAYQTYSELASWFLRNARPSVSETEAIALDIVYNCDKPFVRPFLETLRTAGNGAYAPVYEEMADLYYLSGSGVIRSHSGAVRGSYFQKHLKRLTRRARYNDRKALAYLTNYLNGEVDSRYVAENLRLTVRNLLAFRNYEGITNAIGRGLQTLGLDSPRVSAGADISFWYAYACQKLGDGTRAIAQYENAISKVPDGYYAIQSRNAIEEILSKTNVTVYEYIRGLENRFASAGDTSEKLYWGRILYAWLTGTERELLRDKIAEYARRLTDSPLFDFDRRVLSRIRGSDQYIKFMVHVRYGLTEKARAVLTSAGITDPEIQDLAILQQLVRNRDFRQAWPMFISLSRTDVLEDHFAFLSRDLQALFYPTPYEGEISLALSRLGNSTVDRYLVYAVIRGESMYIPTAHSRAGAKGLMQLMPSTARLISRKYLEDRRPNLYNPANNIILGTAFLDINVKEYGFLTAIASYNGGIRVIQKTRRKFSPPNELELLEIIPYNETREYLKKILSYYARYKNLYDTGGLDGQMLKGRVGG